MSDKASKRPKDQAQQSEAALVSSELAAPAAHGTAASAAAEAAEAAPPSSSTALSTSGEAGFGTLSPTLQQQQVSVGFSMDAVPLHQYRRLEVQNKLLQQALVQAHSDPGDFKNAMASMEAEHNRRVSELEAHVRQYKEQLANAHRLMHASSQMAKVEIDRLGDQVRQLSTQNADLLAENQRLAGEVRRLEAHVDRIEAQFNARELAIKIERFVLRSVHAGRFNSIAVFLRNVKRRRGQLRDAAAALDDAGNPFDEETLEDVRVVLREHKLPANVFAHEQRPRGGEFDALFDALLQQLESDLPCDDAQRDEIVRLLRAGKGEIRNM